MKKDKPSKKKVNSKSDIFQYLEGELAYAIDKVKTDYLIEIDISRREEFIKQVAKSTPEEIVRIVKITDGFIKHLFPPSGVITVKSPSNSPRHVNVDLYQMLKDALSDAKSVYFHPIMRKGFPDDSLAICYTIIWSQALLRLWLYIESNPNVRDGLYVHHIEILQADPKAKPYLEKALNSLSEMIKNKHKKDTGQEIDSKDMWSYIWEAAKEAFPVSVEESLIKAAEGYIKVKYVPYAAAMDLIDEYRKGNINTKDKKTKKYEKDKELSFGTKYDIRKSLKLIESMPDIPKLLEVERTSDLTKWIESLEEPIDREIARLKFKKGLSARAIAKKLSLSKSNVGRRIKKLKKLEQTL